MSQHYLVIIVTQSFATHTHIHTTNSCKRQVSIDGELLFVIVIFNETLHTVENRVENAWLFGGKKCEKCRKPYQNVQCQGKSYIERDEIHKKRAHSFPSVALFTPDTFTHCLPLSLSLIHDENDRQSDRTKTSCETIECQFQNCWNGKLLALH